MTEGLRDRAVELPPGRKWESGDRIPEDLTVAPMQVDITTVALLCVAEGMKFSRYSLTTGESSMSGNIGAITSSVHPVLEGLMHYIPGALATANEAPEV